MLQLGAMCLREDRDLLGAATEGGAGAERELARRYSFFGVVL